MPNNYEINSHKATRLDEYPTNAQKERIYDGFMGRAGCGPFKELRIEGAGPWMVAIHQRGTEFGEYTYRAVYGSFEFDCRSLAGGKAKALNENYLNNASDHGHFEGDATICDDWAYKLLSWVVEDDDQPLSLVQQQSPLHGTTALHRL